jgi:hypothetical protein
VAAPAAAEAHYSQQQAIATLAASAALKQFRAMGEDFDTSWASIRPRMLATVELARAKAVDTSAGYVEALLAETGQSAPAVGEISHTGFLASAPDGRPMGTLLDQGVVIAKARVASGMDSTAALAAAGQWIAQAVLTVMADTGRAVVSADIARRPALTGYTRMLNAPSCSRCVILAGKWFRWNEGFQRHPRCDCRHIPASEDVAGDYRTDPYAYFNSLTERQQERVFGRSEARSIRLGGDIFRIENTRMRGLGTAKGAIRFGTPSRMTVDDILRVAGTRTNAIRLLEQEGYITGPQVPGGNILGQREGFGHLGKGGVARAASDAVTQARLTGVRDPLNRYTMTAAERRLYDANYRYQYALRTGSMPRSIGASSADKYAIERAASADDIAALRAALQAELNGLASAPTSVRLLADELALTGGGGRGVIPPKASASADWPEDIPRLTPRVWQHILHGEPDGSSGGHLAGTGLGKPEFPAEWDEFTIARAVQHVLRTATPIPKGSRAIASGVYEGVGVGIHLKQTKRGWEVTTAFPQLGPER